MSNKGRTVENNRESAAYSAVLCWNTIVDPGYLPIVSGALFEKGSQGKAVGFREIVAMNLSEWVFQYVGCFWPDGPPLSVYLHRSVCISLFFSLLF
jgi:hypothetical protein